jgi:hypothetical protein
MVIEAMDGPVLLQVVKARRMVAFKAMRPRISLIVSIVDRHYDSFAF